MPGTSPVLCAFDASQPSLLAAHAGAWLARELDAPLELVYVVDYGELPALPRRGASLDPVAHATLTDLQEQGEEAWARAAVDAVLSGLPGEDKSGIVLEGRPGEVLRRRAAELEALLLVTGTAARRGLEHVLQGSVSGVLAAEAPCPVVAVTPDAALGDPGPVLVGDDGSADARRAVRHAEALAARLRRPVVNLHVEDGDPVAELARAGEAQRACIAVVGTRGRGPLRGELLGSVSTGLVRAAGRPVVLVSGRAGPPP